jgi:hypothetical protein
MCRLYLCQLQYCKDVYCGNGHDDLVVVDAAACVSRLVYYIVA